MKIAIVTQNYNLGVNGSSIFSENLAEGLAHDGNQVVVISPSNKLHPYEAKKNEVEVIELPALPLAPFYQDIQVTLFPGARIFEIFRQFHPDVVHIMDHYPLCRSAVTQAERLDIPMIATNNFLPDNIILNVGLFRRYHEGVQRYLWNMVFNVFEHTSLVTTPSRAGVEILGRQGLKIPAVSVSCGVDFNRFFRDTSVDVPGIRRKFGLDPDRKLFIFVGRMEQEKRLQLLLKAVQTAAREDIQLAVCGRGMYKNAYEKLAKQLGLDDKAVFTGYVPGAILPRLLNAADFFVMPGDTELQSIATMEAMACGLPVLAANARALPELVKHLENGYLFSPGNVSDAAAGINWLADQFDTWDKLSAASLRIVKPHQIESTITRFEELYRKVVETKAGKKMNGSGRKRGLKWHNRRRPGATAHRAGPFGRQN